MLESISVRNLGCFDDYDYKLEFNKLNVIVGTNNSGKSTIFKALYFMKSSILENLNCKPTHFDADMEVNSAWYNRYVIFENFKNMVYNHDENREIKIQLKLQEFNHKLVLIPNQTKFLYRNLDQHKHDPRLNAFELLKKFIMYMQIELK